MDCTVVLPWIINVRLSWERSVSWFGEVIVHFYTRVNYIKVCSTVRDIHEPTIYCKGVFHVYFDEVPLTDRKIVEA